MGKNTSMLLGDHFEAFIDAQVASGRYASSSEVVRDALRLLEERKLREEAIVRALIEGEESGHDESYSLEAAIAEIDAMPGKP